MKLVSAEVHKALDGLEMLRAGIVQAINLTGRHSVADTAKAAKATAYWKDRSGETRASIRGEWLGSSAGGFVSAGGMARFLENGTRAHEIWARRAKALRFVMNGQVVFRIMVHHPGTQPRPFMLVAARIGARAALYYGELFIGEAIRRSR